MKTTYRIEVCVSPPKAKGPRKWAELSTAQPVLTRAAGKKLLAMWSLGGRAKKYRLVRVKESRRVVESVL